MVARRLLAREQDEGVLGQEPERQPAGARERMSHGDRGHRPLAHEHLDVDVRVADRQRREAQIGGTGGERADLITRRALVQLDVDRRVRRAEPLHHARHERQQRRAGEAHPQRPRLALVDALGVVGGPIEVGEDRPRVAQERVAGRSRLHAPARAREELHPELVLQQPDLVAQRRLRHVQPLRGPAEVQLLGDGDEVAELAELH